MEYLHSLVSALLLKYFSVLFVIVHYSWKLPQVCSPDSKSLFYYSIYIASCGLCTYLKMQQQHFLCVNCRTRKLKQTHALTHRQMDSPWPPWSGLWVQSKTAGRRRPCYNRRVLTRLLCWSSWGPAGTGSWWGSTAGQRELPWWKTP